MMNSLKADTGLRECYLNRTQVETIVEQNARR